MGTPEYRFGSTARPAAGGAASWAQRWLGRQNQALTASANASGGSGMSASPSSPSMQLSVHGKDGGGSLHGSQQRSSFSCNDLETMAKRAASSKRSRGAPAKDDNFSSSGGDDSRPRLCDVAPPLPPDQAQAELHANQALRLSPDKASEGGNSKKKVLFCCHGSRGDVQPLVALALGMMESGDYDVAFWTVGTSSFTRFDWGGGIGDGVFKKNLDRIAFFSLKLIITLKALLQLTFSSLALLLAVHFHRLTNPTLLFFCFSGEPRE